MKKIKNRHHRKYDEYAFLTMPLYISKNIRQIKYHKTLINQNSKR